MDKTRTEQIQQRDQFDEMLRILGEHLLITHEGINWEHINENLSNVIQSSQPSERK